MDIMKELAEVKKEASAISPKIAEEIGEIVKEISKEAALIEEGDRIICTNPVQGIYKGRIYLLDHYTRPNFAVISETDGARVGIFRVDRFVPDWKSF